MGKQYVVIDSTHQRNHETSSKMDIILNKPIHHATSVEVVSFSTANELYNIREGNNVAHFIIWDIQTANADNQPINVYPFAITFEPGFWRTVDIVAHLTEQHQAIVAENGWTTNVDITFSLLATNNIQITASSTSSFKRRMTLHYPDNKGNFYNSVWYRLGFTREHVVPYELNASGTVDNFLRYQNAKWEYLAPNGIYYESALLTNVITGVIGGEPPVQFYVWFCNSTNVKAKQIASTNITVETYPYLYIKSTKLANNDIQITHHNSSGMMTIPTNILQKIVIDVNHGNWLHYETTVNEMFNHDLNDTTISTFDISITDPYGDEFQQHSFKDFQMVLKFETADPHDGEINVEALKSLMLEGFEKRHNCRR